MKDGWKRAFVVAGATGLGYAAGFMNGSAPEGAERPTSVLFKDAGETVGDGVESFSQTGQTVLGEVGDVTARGGNAVSGAGAGVQVPGAPPQAG